MGGGGGLLCCPTARVKKKKSCSEAAAASSCGKEANSVYSDHTQTVRQGEKMHRAGLVVSGKPRFTLLILCTC